MTHSTKRGRGCEAIETSSLNPRPRLASRPDVPLLQLMGDALHGLLGPRPLVLRPEANEDGMCVVVEAQQRVAMGAPDARLGHRKETASHCSPFPVQTEDRRWHSRGGQRLARHRYQVNSAW